MDWIYRIFYYIYTMFTHLGWLCRRNIESYHLIGPDGKQHPLTDNNLCKFEHLLVIYYTPAGTRYRFQHLQQKDVCTIDTIKKTYRTFHEPKKYKLFAVNATVHEHVYTINAIEFNIIGNEIFTLIFNLWLCRNYLHIAPSEFIDVCYIDENTMVCCTKGPIIFKEDCLHIEEENGINKDTGKK